MQQLLQSQTLETIQILYTMLFFARTQVFANKVDCRISHSLSFHKYLDLWGNDYTFAYGHGEVAPPTESQFKDSVQFITAKSVKPTSSSTIGD